MMWGNWRVMWGKWWVVGVLGRVFDHSSSRKGNWICAEAKFEMTGERTLLLRPMHVNRISGVVVRGHSFSLCSRISSGCVTRSGAAEGYRTVGVVFCSAIKLSATTIGYWSAPCMMGVLWAQPEVERSDDDQRKRRKAED